MCSASPSSGTRSSRTPPAEAATAPATTPPPTLSSARAKRRIRTDGDSDPRRGEGSRRPRQPKAATTNRVRDYQALEREFITGTMSLRELCRRHGVTAHSAVMVQARQGGWAEKRRAYRDRAISTYIEQHADRAAAREAEVRDHAIDAIDEAITSSGLTFRRPRRSSSTASGSRCRSCGSRPATWRS